MSRVLKHKRLLVISFFIALLEIILYIVLKDTLFLVLILIIDFWLLLLAMINYKAYRTIRDQLLVLGAKSKVRNVDYLIIGELCDTQPIMNSANNTFVQIKCPNVSEFAAANILERTHSILKENGTVIIVLKKKNIKNQRIDTFDTFFFHPITIKKYSIEKKYKLQKLVLFTNPIRSISLLFVRKNKTIIESKCESYILDFCNERGLNLNFCILI